MAVSNFSCYNHRLKPKFSGILYISPDRGYILCRRAFKFLKSSGADMGHYTYLIILLISAALHFLKWWLEKKYPQATIQMQTAGTDGTIMNVVATPQIQTAVSEPAAEPVKDETPEFEYVLDRYIKINKDNQLSDMFVRICVAETNFVSNCTWEYDFHVADNYTPKNPENVKLVPCIGAHELIDKQGCLN